jgi:hypothetical protein
MTPRIHGNDLFGISPLREWTDLSRWLRVGEVGFVIRIQLLAGNGESVVNGV